jgi:hypothetical protein
VVVRCRRRPPAARDVAEAAHRRSASSRRQGGDAQQVFDERVGVFEGLARPMTTPVSSFVEIIRRFKICFLREIIQRYRKFAEMFRQNRMELSFHNQF